MMNDEESSGFSSSLINHNSSFVFPLLVSFFQIDYNRAGGIMNLKDYFENALAYRDYVALLGDNTSLHHLHYGRFNIPADTADTIGQMKPMKILVLTEPWCGDSLAIFPVVRKIAEANENWELRVLRRDENPELMDRFLTKGARAVPIFLFLSGDFSLLFRFGPRPKAAQDIFEEHREMFKQGKIEKSEVIKKIRNFYSRNHGQAILAELMDSFTRPDFNENHGNEKKD